MEKLSKRSDGIFETQSGSFAIQPRRSSGRDGENQWFDFHPAAWQPAIRVRWPLGEVIAVIPQDTALLMLTRGYARLITAEQADAWNDRVTKQAEADATDPAKAPADAPAAPADASPTEAGERSGRAAIDPNSLPLTPQADYDAAASAGTLDTAPEGTVNSLVPDQTQSQEVPEDAEKEGSSTEETTDEANEDADEESTDNEEASKASGKKGKTKRSL